MKSRIHTFALFVALIILLPGKGNGQGALTRSRQGALPPIEHARQLMSAKQFQSAQWLLEQELRTLPIAGQRDDLLYLLLECYMLQNRFEEAYQTSRQFLFENPTGERRLIGLYYEGLSAYHTERFTMAVQAFEEFEKLSSRHRLFPDVLYRRALSELELGHPDRAEELARRSLQTMRVGDGEASGKENVLMIVALALEHRGEVDAAIEQFSHLLRDFPSSPLATDVRIRLASLHLRKRNTAEALSYLQAVTPATSRQRHEWLFLSAEADYWSGRYSEAAVGYSDFLKQYPAGRFSRQARLGLAWALVHTGRHADAKREFESLVAVTDSITQIALYQSGVLSLLANNTAEAAVAFEQLVERFPYDTYTDNAYFHLGMIRYRAGRYAEARRSFQLAARLFPESELRPEAYRMLGEASLAVGDLTSAQFAFSQIRRSAAGQAPAQEDAVREVTPPRVVDPSLIAAAMFQEGVALYHLGRFNSSAERFAEFIRSNRNHPAAGEAQFWRGEALYQAGKFDEAEQAFTASLSLLARGNPKRSEALYGLSWSLFEQKRFRQAIAAFDRFLAESPDSERAAEVTLRKADCYFFIGEYNTASELYASLSRGTGGSRRVEYAALQLGMSFIQRGDAERGIEHLRSFAQRYPESVYLEVARFNIAWAYFSREQYSLANREFRQFEQYHPVSQLMPRVLLNSGDAFYNLGLHDSARVYYTRLIEEYPSSLLLPDAINGLQFTYQAQGRGREAVAAIEALIAKKSESEGTDELLLQKADILFSQGEFGQAAVEYLRILDRKPAPEIQSRGFYQLGRIYEFENNFSRAATSYEQVVRHFPDGEFAPASMLALGTMLMKQNKWREAMERFGVFEEQFPSSPLLWEAMYNVGVCQQNLKSTDAARKQFERVVEKAPRDEVFADRSRLQLARMLQARKQHTAAIDTLAGIVDRRDDDLAAEALLLWGENALALKKTADALDVFQQVVDGFTHFPLLVERGLLGTGECYERMNDRTRARAAYDKVVATAIDPAIRKDAEERLRRLRR